MRDASFIQLRNDIFELLHDSLAAPRSWLTVKFLSCYLCDWPAPEPLVKEGQLSLDSADAPSGEAMENCNTGTASGDHICRYYG